MSSVEDGLASVAGKVDNLQQDVTTLRQDMSNLQQEVKGGFLEMRVILGEMRLREVDFRGDVLRRLDTLFEALSEFRREYAEHSHPEQ